MQAEDKDTTIFVVKTVVILAIIAFVMWGLVSLFKRYGKEAGESLGYGKTDDTVPQGDWIGSDGNAIPAGQVGAKGWADMLNLPTSDQPLSADFVPISALPPSSLMTSVSDAIYKELNAFWSLPMLTHHGDNVLNLLQNQPTKTYIHEIAQAYKANHTNDLMSDLENVLTDEQQGALAKILMTKPN